MTQTAQLRNNGGMTNPDHLSTYAAAKSMRTLLIENNIYPSQMRFEAEPSSSGPVRTFTESEFRDNNITDTTTGLFTLVWNGNDHNVGLCQKLIADWGQTRAMQMLAVM